MKELKLFVFVWMFLAVNSWRTQFIKQKCENEGRKLENGYFTIPFGDIRIYHCKEHYVSNVTKLEDMKFECKWNRKLGKYEWKAMSSRYSHGGQIFLKDVACKEKKKCIDPVIPEHMTRSSKSRYQVFNVVIKGKDQSSGYFTGDILEYNCKTGFTLSKESDANGYQFGSYDLSYYYYEQTLSSSTTEAPVKNTVLSEITCDNDGLWNGVPNADLYFGKCKKIVCDATSFSNISYGNITNYKDKFEFFEEMYLECDEGYRPKSGVKSAVCETSLSFNEINLGDFGCEPIQCIEPESPRHGSLRLDHNYLNGTAEFECEYGYRMIGNPKWQCQSNGKWDHECVVCTNEDMYCAGPCLPIGATITRFGGNSIGDVIEYGCKSGMTYYGGSTNRTCMWNRYWSGSPIDCTGTSLFEPGVGIELLSAMKKISENKTDNATDINEAVGKSINVGSIEGVDVYLLVDISRSISSEMLNLTKNFLHALLPELGINDGASGTRLALTYFGSKSARIFDQHNPQITSNINEQLFQSYQDAIKMIKLDMDTIIEYRNITSSGTAITLALKDIGHQMGTKQLARQQGGLDRHSQEVLIIISDGQFTSNGDPTNEANYLQKLGLEIYSIFIGDKNANNGRKTMEKIASKIEGEQHFFQISSDETDFKRVLSSMISTELDLSCGTTKPHLTNIFNANENKYETDAKRDAWPWMANIRTKDTHVCGGSLIRTRWILTAAHCFDGKDDKEIAKVHLNKLKMDDREGIDVYNIEQSYKHEKYNKSERPTFVYDIALIKLVESVHAKPEVLPVCLWNNAIQNETNEKYENLFNKKFGVVTGWGKTSSDSDISDHLKQMQMEVKSNKECEENLSDDEKKDFNETLMFCAGGKEIINGAEEIIDTCRGDSGGPFVVRHPLDEKRFIQTGIVSYGYGCKNEKGKYGFYTKLTDELLKWIDATITKNEN